MSLIGGVLDLASSIVSASHGGGSEGGSTSAELNLGSVQVSLQGKDLSVKVDGQEVAKVDVSKLGAPSGDRQASAPPLDLHSSDTFEDPKPKAKVANLFDADSGGGSKPGGTGEGLK